MRSTLLFGALLIAANFKGGAVEKLLFLPGVDGMQECSRIVSRYDGTSPTETISREQFEALRKEQPDRFEEVDRIKQSGFVELSCVEVPVGADLLTGEPQS